MAHEISHIKTKDTSRLPGKIKLTLSYMNTCLTLGLGLSIGAVVFSSLMSLPFISVLSTGMAATFPPLFAVGLGVLTFGGMNMLAKIGMNFVSRIGERRADRNAIFMTRDIKGAQDMLCTIDDEISATKVPKLLELETHPSLRSRLKNLREAFNQASQYEPANIFVPCPPHEVLYANQRPYHDEDDKRRMAMLILKKLNGPW